MIDYAPLNSKQTEYIKKAISDKYWLNVLEGGKRAGKNVISIIIFAAMLEDHEDKIHLVGGYTNATAQTNVIDCNGFGIEHIFKGRCRWGKYKNNSALYIKTKTGEKIVVVTGGGKADSFKSIKGNTYGMAYLDEVNELHESFVKETIDRTLASSDIRHIWTLNPKTPKHKFYTHMLDKYMMKDDVLYEHFNIFDNLAIDNKRLKQIESMYDEDSVWYKREILGQRVAAEGKIYKSFKDTHITNITKRRYDALSCGVDIGGTDATVFTLVGLHSNYTNTDVIDTYYHKNNDEKEAEKSYNAYVDDFVEWAKEHKRNYPAWRYVFVDSADKLFRLALIERCAKEGLDLDINPSYKKDGILFRIKLTQLLMMNDRIHIDKSCTELIEAFNEAIWDPKAEEKGKQERLDDGTSNIDSLDSFEYAIVPYKNELVEGLNYEKTK